MNIHANHDTLISALPTGELRKRKLSRQEFTRLKRNHIRVVLDGVNRYANIGAIFRLCDAMLVERLYITGMSEPLNLKHRRLRQTGKGTMGWVPWEQHDSPVPVIEQAKVDGYQIVVCELASHSVTPQVYTPADKVCLVMGAETDGISKAVSDMANIAVEIPMYGMGNSLNVSTAAAILLHRIVHGLHKA